MRKHFLIIAGIVLALSLTAMYCGGGTNLGDGAEDVKGDCDHYTGEEVYLDFGFGRTEPLESQMWVLDPPNTGEVDGKKVLYIYAEEDSEFKDNAYTQARAKAFGNLAESIKTQVIKQVAIASETLGALGNESKEQVSKALNATRAKAEVRGVLEKSKVVVKMYRYGTIDTNNCEEGRGGLAYWRCYVQLYIPYDYFIELRDGIVRDAVESQVPNERQQQLLNEVDNAFSQMDSGDW